MRILVLSGSPRKGGNSDLLAAEFAASAQEKGHEVDVVRVAERKIGGCAGCERCWENGGAPCVQKDGMQELYPMLNLADMVVFATPCYYFGFPAQLKAVMDRFYPFSKEGKSDVFGDKQCAMIVCGGSEDEDDFEAQVRSYEIMTDSIGWEDRGILVVTGVNERGDVKGTDWMQAARDLAMDL